MPSEYPAWSSGTNQTNIRKGSLSFSDMDTLFSVATTSESSTSPLPLSWDDSVWDFPLPNSNTTAALAPQQYVCEDSDDVNAIPAWESAPSDWDYESAHKVAEKLLSLDLSNENSAHDYMPTLLSSRTSTQIRIPDSRLSSAEIFERKAHVCTEKIASLHMARLS